MGRIQQALWGNNGMGAASPNERLHNNPPRQSASASAPAPAEASAQAQQDQEEQEQQQEQHQEQQQEEEEEHQDQSIFSGDQNEQEQSQPSPEDEGVDPEAPQSEEPSSVPETCNEQEPTPQRGGETDATTPKKQPQYIGNEVYSCEARILKARSLRPPLPGGRGPRYIAYAVQDVKRVVQDTRNLVQCPITTKLQQQQQPSYMRYIEDESCRDKEQEAESVEHQPNEPLAPGAYPSGLESGDEDNEWLQDGHLDVGVRSSGNVSGLVMAVANLVSQPFSNLDEAEHVDPQLELQKTEEQRKEHRALLLCMLLIGSFLVAGVVLLAVFFAVGPSGDNTNTTPANLLRERANQTLAPPLSDQELLLSLLPMDTVQSIQADATTTSPQARALAWLLEDPSFSSYEDWRKIQRFALATFFFSTGGQWESGKAKGKWLIKTHWLSYDRHECQWFSSNHLGPVEPEAETYGLVGSYPSLLYDSGLCRSTGTEEEEGKVERLVFFANGLVGELPPEIGLLTELRGLALANCPIGGTIPTQIGLLSKLEFFGSSLGGLGGALPSELGNAKNLTHVLMFGNELSGSIPTQIGMLTNLKGLMLDRNNIEGALPTELGLLSDAVWISSFENKLTGRVPTQLGQLSSSLRFLALHSNNYQGTFPSQLGLLSSVQELNLERCSLTGTLPTEMGQLAALQKLYLVKNNFSGQIPSQLGLLQNLWYMDLGKSQISGSLPSEMMLARKLHTIFLSDTQITGSIPTQIGFLSHLVHLKAVNNGMSGVIPTEIGFAPKLRSFELEYNFITGSIPSQLGLLESMIYMRLGGNQLSSSIPTEIGLATSLQDFSVSGSEITGPIPSQLGLWAKVDRLNFNGNQITGTIPTELGALPLLYYLGIRQAGNNTLAGPIPTEVCALPPLRIEIDCASAHALCSEDCNCGCN